MNTAAILPAACTSSAQGAIVLAGAFAVTLNWWLLVAARAAAYLAAWVGHLVFERNGPATFRNPWYSFLADWVLFKDMLTGKTWF